MTNELDVKELDDVEAKAEYHLREAAKLLIGRFSVIKHRRRAAKVFLLEALDRCGGNQCKAAKLVEIHRNTVPRVLAELPMKELH